MSFLKKEVPVEEPKEEMTIKELKEKFSLTKISGKLTMIAAAIAGLSAIYSFVSPFFNKLSSQRLDKYDEAFKVYNRIIEAETDIDKKVLKDYGIELYHCNKDQYGTPKFSFTKVDGLMHEAEFSRSKQTWTYRDDQGHWIPIQTLAK
jgi:hypothetical protein